MPFAIRVADRMERYMDLRGIEEEDLGILIAPWYREYDDIEEGVLLPEDDQYWEMHLHAADVDLLRDPDERPKFSYNVSLEYTFDMRYEDMVEHEYPEWINIFEERFPEAEHQYVDLDNL